MFRKKEPIPVFKKNKGVYSKAIANYSDIVNVELMNADRFKRQYGADWAVDESKVKTAQQHQDMADALRYSAHYMGDWRTDNDRGSYMNPETAGQKMFAKMNYYEEYKPNYPLEGEVRIFIKKKAQCTESVVFEKHINHVKGRREVCFSKQERSTGSGRHEPSRPELVHPNELEAIIQIITEWSD